MNCKYCGNTAEFFISCPICDTPASPRDIELYIRLKRFDSDKLFAVSINHIINSQIIRRNVLYFYSELDAIDWLKIQDFFYDKPNKNYKTHKFRVNNRVYYWSASLTEKNLRSDRFLVEQDLFLRKESGQVIK